MDETASEFAYIVGYGTFLRDVLISLAKGDQPTTWGESIEVLGPVIVPGFQRLWPENPPFPIVREISDSSFSGILFRIPVSKLARFDMIEGVPDLYNRIEIDVDWKGSLTKAFLYIPNDNLLNHFLKRYRIIGREPGKDDWLEYLEDILTDEEKRVFPEIFMNYTRNE